ncbi:MAG TPA: CoA transferase [Gammaproteobacteria bacterium]|nr:CoA transferase [Gammaproteobacteria bacterium]
MKHPLEGITVVDFSMIASGPYCSQNLADMGARVIRVEPLGGDELRKGGPPFINDEGSYYMALNRNKESIALNLTTEAGQKVAHALCAKADVVIENFTPSVPAKLGIDYDTLKALNPELIYLAISGYGDSGPYKDRPGLDLVFQGMAGMMSLTGEAEGGPMRSPVAIVDMNTAVYASYAIMVALWGREKGQGGQRIEISMFNVAVAMQSMLISTFLGQGDNLPRKGNRSYTSVTDCFKTKDAYINVSIAVEKHWKALCDCLGLPELAADPAFADAQSRVKNQDHLCALIADRFKEKTTAEWMDIMGKAHFPCGPVNSYQDLLEDPQLKHDGIWLSQPHPKGGDVPNIAFPVRFSGWQQVNESAPPVLGQNTRAVLSELGYDDDAITELLQAGIAKTSV